MALVVGEVRVLQLDPIGVLKENGEIAFAVFRILFGAPIQNFDLVSKQEILVKIGHMSFTWRLKRQVVQPRCLAVKLALTLCLAYPEANLSIGVSDHF